MFQAEPVASYRSLISTHSISDPAFISAENSIWSYLNGAYLITEWTTRLSRNTMAQIELLFLRRLVHKVSSTSTHEALELSESESKALTDFLWHFVASDATPVYCLIPERFHSLLQSLSNGCQTEDGRARFWSAVQPLLEPLKNKRKVDAAKTQARGEA